GYILAETQSSIPYRSATPIPIFLRLPCLFRMSFFGNLGTDETSPRLKNSKMGNVSSVPAFLVMETLGLSSLTVAPWTPTPGGVHGTVVPSRHWTYLRVERDATVRWPDMCACCIGPAKVQI